MRTTVLTGKIGPAFGGIVIETEDHTVDYARTGDKRVDSDRISETLRIMAGQYSYATATVTLGRIAVLGPDFGPDVAAPGYPTPYDYGAI